MTHKQASSLGGSVTATQSPAKAAALRRLHRARRGIPTNDCGLTPRDYLRVLGHVHRSLAIPGGPTVRGLARHLLVSDRTMRRWLQGHDIAPAWAVVRLKAMTAFLGRGAKKEMLRDIAWARKEVA